MLTPTELKAKQFSRALFGGYSMADVDRLLDELIVDYEKLYTESAEQKKKVEKLLDRIEVYEEQEESIKAAILNAQRMCDTIVKQANQQAELIELDARAKSEKLKETAEDAVIGKRQELEGLQDEAGRFREKLVSLYREHLALITALPVYEDAEQPQLETAAEDVYAADDATQEIKFEDEAFEDEKADGAEPDNYGFENLEPYDAPGVGKDVSHNAFENTKFGDEFAAGDTATIAFDAFEAPSGPDDTEQTMVFERPVDVHEHEPGEGAISSPAQPMPRPIATDVVELMAEEEVEGYEEIKSLSMEDSLQFGPNFDVATGEKLSEE